MHILEHPGQREYALKTLRVTIKQASVEAVWDLRFYQQDRKVPGSPQHRQKHTFHFSYGQGLVKQILIFVGKADPLPFSFLTGPFPGISAKLSSSQSHFLPSLQLLLGQLVSFNCLQNYLQLWHSSGPAELRETLSKPRVCLRDRARSVQPVAKIGNWRINQLFFFFFGLKIGQIHKGIEVLEASCQGQSYQISDSTL